MPALILESSDGLRADILEEEELKILVLYGVKDFWLTDVDGCAAAPSSGHVLEGGGCGRCGDDCGRKRRSGWPDHCLGLRHFVPRDGRRFQEMTLFTLGIGPMVRYHHGKQPESGKALRAFVTRGLLPSVMTLQAFKNGVLCCLITHNYRHLPTRTFHNGYYDSKIRNSPDTQL